MKKCSSCKIVKEDDEFSKSQLIKSGGYCRSCNTIKARAYRQKNKEKIKKYQHNYDLKYYQENKKEIKQNKKIYYQEHKDEILVDRHNYYQEHKDEKIAYNKKYYQEHKDEILKEIKIYEEQHKEEIKKYRNEYYKNKRKIDKGFKLKTAISANINYHIKNNDSSKNGESCLKYLNFNIEELINHLEQQFEQWMSWDNYGVYNSQNWNDNDSTTWTWQIDHIIPQSDLLYTSMEDDNFKKCWSLENLRPYSAKQNLLDGINRTRHLDDSTCP